MFILTYIKGINTQSILWHNKPTPELTNLFTLSLNSAFLFPVILLRDTFIPSEIPEKKLKVLIKK